MVVQPRGPDWIPFSQGGSPTHARTASSHPCYAPPIQAPNTPPPAAPALGFAAFLFAAILFAALTFHHCFLTTHSAISSPMATPAASKMEPSVSCVYAQPQVSSRCGGCPSCWFLPRPMQNASTPQISSLPLLSPHAAPFKSGNQTSCCRGS
jgi:hypothetical protein